MQRLVDWNSNLLLQMLQNVVARRAVMCEKTPTQNALDNMAQKMGVDTLVIDEVVEIINMPEFTSSHTDTKVVVSDEVVNQLRDFVAKIASMYNNNPCTLKCLRGGVVLKSVRC